jgi:hypothetical protein
MSQPVIKPKSFGRYEIQHFKSSLDDIARKHKAKVDKAYPLKCTNHTTAINDGSAKLKPEEKIRKMAVASCHYYGAIDCFDFEEADAEVLEYNKKVTPKRERIIRKIEFDAAKTLDKIIISPDEALEVVEAFENDTYV